jgi:hypothetical protein
MTIGSVLTVMPPGLPFNKYFSDNDSTDGSYPFPDPNTFIGQQFVDIYMEISAGGTGKLESFSTSQESGIVTLVYSYVPDQDGDGMPDSFEEENGLNPLDPTDAHEDKDFDGLSNLEEFKRGTMVNNPDTDGDGMSDGNEVAAGRNPLVNEVAILTIINFILLD